MGNNQSQEVKKVIIEPGQVTKDGQTKTGSVVVITTGQLPQTSAAPVVQTPFSIKSYVECATDSLLSVGPWIRRQKQELANSQMALQCKQTQTYIDNEIKAPLCKLYNAIPEKLTEAKFELISPYNYNQRFATVNILCALTAIATITRSKVNPISRVLRTTRNAGFMFLFGGLLIAPEIYNPFIRSY